MSPSTLRPLRASLAVATLAALYWIAVLAVLGAGPPHPLDDVWEDGLAARQLLAGHGFRTTMIYPPLWTLRDPATMTVPLVVHGPLLPSALALPLRLCGPGLLDHLAWAAAALAVVIAVQVFRLGARWFGAPVGVAAALLWTLAPILLQAVAHSLSVVIGAVLLMTALDLIAGDRARPLLAGLALGIGYGVRSELLLAVPVLAAYVGGRGPEGWRHAGRLGVGFLAVAGAWWWHQAAATGMPFFNLSSYMLLGSTPAHPGTTLMRDFGAPPASWPTIFRAELPTLWTKWIPLVPRAARHLLTGLGASLGWLIVIGAGRMMVASDRRREAGLVVLLAMIPIGMMILANPTKLYLVPFLGLLAVAAARGAEWLQGRFRFLALDSRRGVVALAVVALLSSVPALLQASREGRRTHDLLAGERVALARAGMEDGSLRPIFSDRPDFVAWTTGRPALWLERDEYLRLEASAKDGAAQTTDLPALDPVSTWFHDDHWSEGAPVH